MTDCCRAPVGGDVKLFDSLREVLSSLEGRESDRIIMDMSLPAKRALYARLIAVSERIASHLED